MTVLLDAIRAEIEPLKQRLDTLREIEALALRLNGDGGGGADEPRKPNPSSAAAPARTSARPAAPRAVSRVSASPAAAGDLGAKTHRVLEILRERDDWMSVSEVATAEGASSSSSAIKSRVQTLVKRGLVEARGRTVDRRYRASGAPAPKPPSSRDPERVREDAADTRRDVLDTVERVGPASFATLASATGIGRGQLLDRLQELARSGQIVQNVDRTWQTAASKDAEIAVASGNRGGAGGHSIKPELHEALLAQIQARPGGEPDLARRLKTDREDIAFACGELLEQGAVILDPDGTYRRPGGAPASVATR